MAITQSSPSNSLDKSSKNKKRIIASVWLIMALLVGAAALALWMFSSAPIFEAKKEADTEVPAEVMASNIEQINRIEQLNELSSDVKPISFDALVRELRDYPKEFKDSKYLKKNKGKWTLQVMDVSEHEIITDYLNSRKDRQKFAYFRYRDSDNQPRYLLTYDVMGNKQQATNIAESVDFELPKNVQVIPEEISAYLDIIENYELAQPIKDLSTNRTRQVKLQPTKRELAARRPEPQVTQNDNTSSSSNNDSNSNQSSQQPQAAPSEIRNSTDTSDTLSVQEQRNVVVSDSESDQNTAEATKPKADPAKPKVEPTKPKVEPTKPQEKPEKKADEASKNTQKPAAGAEGDSIKQLIDQKTE